MGSTIKTVCKLNQCTGCMACVDTCPKEAINIEDRLSAYNAIIDSNKCIGCNCCHNICQQNHPPEFRSPISWHQGWINDAKQRQESSSGGFAAAISRAFVASGGIVCSCTFHDGQFCFAFAETQEELFKFVGSKYVKSNPIGIYKKIKSQLQKGRKVLFLGLPCQVSAVKNYVGDSLMTNLYTADLICHGTPSPKLLELFLKQHGIALHNLHTIRFREAVTYRISCDGKGISANRTSDRYSISFLNGLCSTENCYSCRYSRTERVSDLTLGDSWGSELAQSEQKKGISLALCQTEKGQWLLKNADVSVFDVDLKRAVSNNQQLRQPSINPFGRNSFFQGLSRNESFDEQVFRRLPKQCVRQEVKKWLIRSGILR